MEENRRLPDMNKIKSGINSDKFMNALGFGIGAEKNRKRRNWIVFMSLVVIGIFITVSFLLGGWFNTNYLNNKIVEKDSRISDLENENLNLITDNNALQRSIQNSEIFVIEANKTVENAIKELSTQTKTLNEISKDYNNIKLIKDQLQKDYNDIVQINFALKNNFDNAVRTICCSLDDVKVKRNKKWDMSGGNIVCSGSNNINCGAGVI